MSLISEKDFLTSSCQHLLQRYYNGYRSIATPLKSLAAFAHRQGEENMILFHCQTPFFNKLLDKVKIRVLGDCYCIFKGEHWFRTIIGAGGFFL